MSGPDVQQRLRYVPLIRNVWVRAAVGLALLLVSMMLAAAVSRGGRLGVLIPGGILAWAVAAYVTHKYVHKYPQRYFTYLAASHAKAAMIMAFLLWVLSWMAGSAAAQQAALWIGYVLFIAADTMVSAICRRELPSGQPHVAGPSQRAGHVPVSGSDDVTGAASCPAPIDKQAVLHHIRSRLPVPLVAFVDQNLPYAHGGSPDVLILDRLPAAGARSQSAPAGLVVGRARLNDVYRLSEFLLFCAQTLPMRGYVVVRYAPLENVAELLRDRYGGVLSRPASVLYFLWYQAIPKTPLLDTIQFLITRKGNRALSKAEVWGRLSYCGLRVVAESCGKGECYIIAQRDALPVQDKKPSYYPVITLEKVGLDGKVMRLHKLRSMFPYSEFLQKRIYEEHGLTATGKFANDFRITRFGRFVRRYWLDELPQVFDWLRGDIKLVGMRATSPQYLGLYPREVANLYVEVKPGLVPPIFDETTNGFDQIVKVEHDYLKRYLAAPIRTDVVYFFRTWRDIFRRGVRGK